MTPWIIYGALVALCLWLSHYVYTKLDKSNMWIHPNVEMKPYEEYSPRQLAQLHSDFGWEVVEKTDNG